MGNRSSVPDHFEPLFMKGLKYVLLKYIWNNFLKTSAIKKKSAMKVLRDNRVIQKLSLKQSCFFY